MVADGDRDRVVVVADADLDRPALAVVEGVAEQVAQDPFDAPRVDVDRDRLRPAASTTTSLPCRSASTRFASTVDATTPRMSTVSASSAATPAS